MEKTRKIEPNITLTIYNDQIRHITFIVKNAFHEILFLDFVNCSQIDTLFTIRKTCISKISNIIDIYKPDTVIIEKTKLFTDGITKYPDPELYRNVLLNYGLQVSIEDHFLNNIKHLLVIPYTDWTKVILGNFKYSFFSNCKNHVLNYSNIDDNFTQIIVKHNLYSAVCFSECTKYNQLINKKFEEN